MPPSLPISTPHLRPPGARNPWPERIALFAIGLAIGCLLLGTIQMGRRAAARRAELEDQQRQQQPPPPPAAGTAPSTGPADGSPLHPATTPDR